MQMTAWHLGPFWYLHSEDFKKKKCKMKSKRKRPASGRVQVPPSRARLSSVSSASLLHSHLAPLTSHRGSGELQALFMNANDCRSSGFSITDLSVQRREGNLFKMFRFYV